MKIQSLFLSLALAATAVLNTTGLFVISERIENSLWWASTRTSQMVDGLETLL